MLGGGEAWISVFKLFPLWLLLFEDRCCHDPK
jgi:hypothetical protein